MNTRNFSLLFFLIFLISCSSATGDARLEGTWTSNKELTLSNIRKDIKLTEKQLTFLNESLGSMQYIHKGNKIAVNFKDMPFDKLSFSKYNVYESDKNSVTVGHKAKEKIKIYFSGNCIFHITEWGFNEYFCK